MKSLSLGILLLFSRFTFAQSAAVDVSVTPAGSFKAKSADVRGAAKKVKDGYEAKNIMVGLKNIQTGMPLRDTHTKKYLEVEKFPDAILLSAKGAKGKGDGVIKIKGIEHKINGTYKIEDGKLTAIFPLHLADYKITGIKYMSAGVEDLVTVTVVVPIKD